MQGDREAEHPSRRGRRLRSYALGDLCKLLGCTRDAIASSLQALGANHYKIYVLRFFRDAHKREEDGSYPEPAPSEDEDGSDGPPSA
jgi:hypothetical protein